MFGINYIASKLGITRAGHIKNGPEGQLIPVYAIRNKGWLASLMNNTAFPIGGISLYPIGIFALGQEFNTQLIKHECFHYEEQSKSGILNWLLSYYREIISIAIIHSSFRKGYCHSSYEKRATDWSKSSSGTGGLEDLQSPGGQHE